MGFERGASAGRKHGVLEMVSFESAPVVASSVSWRKLYDENWEWVFRLVRRLGWQDIEVEDAVQDVFIVLLDKLAGFEGRAELRTWVHRICINVVHEHRRRA